MEFFLAPYPVGGDPSQGDPTKAPDVTINSWGCPTSEGCSALTLQAGVEAQRAAGIEMVVAAGNSGPSCSTVTDPPSLYDASYTVGALNTGTDTIASFSSRGPVTADGSMRTKPDISAPGTNTRSASNSSDSAYTFASGTSMATPHIAGAVALLWSAHPELKNNPDGTEPVMNNTAVHILSSACGPSDPPNNVFGYGRVDILAAVDSVMSDTVTISKAQYSIARSQLSVQATDSNTAAILTVKVTSSGQILGTMQTRGDGNYRLKLNGVANPQNVTVTSNLGGSASKNVKAR
jgi:subtilisin family serine protease